MIVKLVDGSTLLADEDTVFESVFKGERNLQIGVSEDDGHTLEELAELLTAKNIATVEVQTDEGVLIDTITGFVSANVVRRISSGAFHITVTLYKTA